MKKIGVQLLLCFIAMAACSNPTYDFDLQGHRGARGLLPENSIPAFLKAVEIGVTTLELDVVVSKDGKVVVSHEPWFNSSICLDPDGEKIEEDRDRYNIYDRTYDQIRQFDCGSLGNPRFPQQEKMSVYKPLLSEVIAEVEKASKASGKELMYNIEIKSSVEGDYKFHPSPETFSDFVYRTISDVLPAERFCIQSFDFRILKYWHQKYPEYTLAALVGNEESWEQNVEALGFTPAIYSPHFKLITQENVNQLHEEGIQVVPWTVNEKSDMLQLLEWGVDGLITDYPDRAIEFKD
ncbi:glycerophosphodiester phosphodiesterase family protein [Flammeovirgaceae bacterium SG7u.111]|nr:glycerophosphodiester phosphodiesterase family protein [Flammeovirgaceae bacterium SG7u.132]WPO37418.1 glycerophosphodiester phosphodiesterase family protein [Flammeovirgaceae bacterium SG7u.111]